MLLAARWRPSGLVSMRLRINTDRTATAMIPRKIARSAEPPPTAAAWWCTPRGANPPAKGRHREQQHSHDRATQDEPRAAWQDFRESAHFSYPLIRVVVVSSIAVLPSPVCVVRHGPRAPGITADRTIDGRCQCGRRHHAASSDVSEGASRQRWYACRSSNPGVSLAARGAPAFRANEGIATLIGGVRPGRVGHGFGDGVPGAGARSASSAVCSISST